MPLPQSDFTAPSNTFREFGQAIAQQNLPAFGQTMQEVFAATEDDTLSGQQIAEIILHDPALTSTLLRVANSAGMGYAGQKKVLTVSRSVVVMGHNAIRSLCISALAVENMPESGPFRARLLAALGTALHVAVQAKDLGLRKGLRRDEVERLFLEALMGRIGELAFWCYGGEFAERVDALLESGMNPELAEQSVLGMSLRQFSHDLLRAWNLDAVIRDSAEVAVAVQLGRAAQQGWSNPEARQAVQYVAALFRQPETETLKRLQGNAEQASRLAVVLGAGAATKWIPATPVSTDEEAAPDPTEQPEIQPAEPMADMALQLRMLTEMSAVAVSRKDLPMLFEACLEGLHRAVGLDRCVLCLMTPARDRLLARLGAGPGAADLRGRLQVPWTAMLETQLQAGSVRRFSAEQPPPDFLLQATAVHDCLIATLTVDQKIIGLFYADQQTTQRSLTAEIFCAFQ